MLPWDMSLNSQDLNAYKVGPWNFIFPMEKSNRRTLLFQQLISWTKLPARKIQIYLSLYHDEKKKKT